MALGPDFLVIGGPRAGTTWLYRQFEGHPSIWVPPIKELHYFDVERPTGVAEDRRSLRFKFYRYNAAILLRQAGSRFSGGRLPRDPLWSLRYLFGGRSDQWYCGLFRAAKAERIVAGEVTPAYMTLEPEVVRQVRNLNPAMKIILLLRNPIDAVWSMARKSLARGGAIDRKRVWEFMHSPQVQRRSDYLRARCIWSSVFPEEQVFTGFFDELSHAPLELADRLTTFLGVAPLESRDPTELRASVNAGPPLKLEADLQTEIDASLRKRYRRQIQELADELGGPARQWLSRLEEREAHSHPGGASQYERDHAPESDS